MELIEAADRTPALRALAERLTTPLKVESKIRVMRSVGAGRALPDLGIASSSLVAGDLYRLSLRVSDTCYVYAHRIDEAARVTVLHPSSGTSERWIPGVSYSLPTNREIWYRRVDVDEVISISASRTRGLDLQRAPEEMRNTL